MAIFGSFFSEFRIIPSSYPRGMIPGYVWSYEGMIGPIWRFSDFFIYFRIIPSSYPQGTIPGYDEVMIGPIRV